MRHIAAMTLTALTFFLAVLSCAGPSACAASKPRSGPQHQIADLYRRRNVETARALLKTWVTKWLEREGRAGDSSASGLEEGLTLAVPASAMTFCLKQEQKHSKDGAVDAEVLELAERLMDRLISVIDRARKSEFAGHERLKKSLVFAEKSCLELLAVLLQSLPGGESGERADALAKKHAGVARQLVVRAHREDTGGYAFRVLDKEGSFRPVAFRDAVKVSISCPPAFMQQLELPERICRRFKLDEPRPLPRPMAFPVVTLTYHNVLDVPVVLSIPSVDPRVAKAHRQSWYLRTSFRRGRETIARTRLELKTAYMYKDATLQPGKSLSVPLEMKNIYDFPDDELGSYTFAMDGQSVSFEIVANPLAPRPTVPAWVWWAAAPGLGIAAAVFAIRRRRKTRAASSGSGPRR
jgi:hypothetical protein